MGIGNDIRPKRKFSYANHNQHANFEHEKTKEKEPQPKFEEEGTEIPIITDEVPSFKDIENLEDSFFQEDKKPEKHQIEHKFVNNDIKQPKRFPGKQIIAILFIILFGLVIYQNFDSIKDLCQPKEQTQTVEDTIETENIEDIYESETPATTETTPMTPTTTTPTTTTPATTTPATTTTPTTTTPTTTTTNRTFTLEVLNGNGVAGSATTIKNILVKAGFKVDAIGTASKSNYTNTNIYYKTGYEAEAARVKNALSSRTCVLQKSDTIAKNYNVVVVVGKN